MARVTDVEPKFYGMPNMNGHNSTTYIATFAEGSQLIRSTERDNFATRRDN